MGKKMLLGSSIVAGLTALSLYFAAPSDIPISLPYLLIIFAMICMTLYAHRKPHLAADGLVHLSVSSLIAEANQVLLPQVEITLSKLLIGNTSNGIIHMPFMGYVEGKNHFGSLYEPLNEAGDNRSAAALAVSNILAVEPISINKITDEIPESVAVYKKLHNEICKAIKDGYLLGAHLTEEICQFDDNSLDQFTKELTGTVKIYGSHFTELGNSRKLLLEKKTCYMQLMNEPGLLGLGKRLS